MESVSLEGKNVCLLVCFHLFTCGATQQQLSVWVRSGFDSKLWLLTRDDLEHKIMMSINLGLESDGLPLDV